MSQANKRTVTRAVQVIEHLKSRGHISEGSALVEYGRFRLGDAIHRLRTTHAALVPEGYEIITLHKQDTKGDRYGEYHLVQKAATEPRRIVSEARARAAAAPAV